ncbi:MAG: carboxy terminal-processing peptidase [Bacteroidetes bacterium]|nr:carboxy terminal-processing peptidase [Bacteroidota bacterium]
MKIFMKLKLGILALVVFFGIVGFYTLKPDAKLSKEQVIIGYVFQVTEAYHYLNLKIDDDFSKKAFHQYLKSLDYNKRILLAEDVNQLKKHETSIDDEITKSESLDLFEESLTLIQKREQEIQPYYKEILAQPMNFSVKESVENDADKRDFPKTEAERKELWRKLLKLQVLSRYYTMKDAQSSDSVKVKKSDADLEKEAREKVLKSYDEWSKSIQQVDRMERFSIYVNALLSVYDPHTSYFAPRAKQDFDISMTGRLEGIGATLSVKDGFVKVNEIVPGSASSRQGELEAGDLILEVAQGAEKPVDVVDMRLDKVVSMIRGPKGTEVRLTIKKVDGTTRIIKIIRDIVIIEETYAKSAILQKDGDANRYGYIDIPQFYADFSGKGGRNCSDDLLVEVERLAKENTKGTIIDLRNNGGGSLQDCIKMIGLFIETGPVVIVDDKSGQSQAYTDPDPRIRDAKPLIVLVNGFSASASEIFAAAIQDYHRGVIIGTASTFGKGSVQRFFDLDEFVPATSEYASYMSLGEVKITMSKFFRINGGATQLKGVVPDIILPDVYSKMKSGEKEEDFAMPWTKIRAAQYQSFQPTPNYKALSAAMKMRVDTTTFFKQLDKHLILMEKEEKNTLQSLLYADYDRESKALEASSDALSAVAKRANGIKVDFLRDEAEAIKTDKSKKERLENFHKGLVKDAYIYQALLTLSMMN